MKSILFCKKNTVDVCTVYSKVLTIARFTHPVPKYDHLCEEICDNVQGQQCWLKSDFKHPLEVNQVVMCIAILLKHASITVKGKFNLARGIWILCCHSNCV